MSKPYVMTISRTTVDKLGIKLYDKASAVVSELIANAYDADAETVTVEIPLGRWLATKSEGKIVDQGLEIIIKDDGHGMTPDVINDFFLRVGINPRQDPKRGLFSFEKKRPRMGRKGIGKLAPFGICEIIEVKSSGMPKTAKGYKTAHFILNYNDINQETDAPYEPETGPDDGKYMEKRGTTITLRSFLYRRTPDTETFHRQMARRFGIGLQDFVVKIMDTSGLSSFTVGELPIDIDESTKIIVDKRPVLLENGIELPVKGWVAYAKEPYKNVEVAGVRIYARGRLVSTTRDFGLEAGFTGEYTLRSYLVGTIVADWLDSDDADDLITSGRQDILWDSDLGAAFIAWGQSLLRELGNTSWSPHRERTADLFLEESNLEEEARKRFNDESLVESAVDLGKILGRAASRSAVKERPEYVAGLRELVLTVTPHKMIVDKLRDAQRSIAEDPLEMVVRIFNETRIAETASLGQVAFRRIEAIVKLEDVFAPGASVEERHLQELLENAPWLINPQWTVLQANQSFKSMRNAFESWYEEKYGALITTSTIGTAREELKRPDFVMLHVGKNIEIVELKRPGHALTDEEFERIQEYYDRMTVFLDNHPVFKSEFPSPHVMLVCDDLNLGPIHSNAYERLKEHGNLEKKGWRELLHDSKKAHGDFLDAFKTP